MREIMKDLSDLVSEFVLLTILLVINAGVYFSIALSLIFLRKDIFVSIYLILLAVVLQLITMQHERRWEESEEDIIE